jgi:hypothetical protein
MSEDEQGTAEDFGDNILEQITDPSIATNDHATGHDHMVSRQFCSTAAIFNLTRLDSLLIDMSRAALRR